MDINFNQLSANAHLGATCTVDAVSAGGHDAQLEAMQDAWELHALQELTKNRAAAQMRRSYAVKPWQLPSRR